MRYVITLPYPMSANKYWHPVKIGNHISIVPTKEAKAFKTEIGWLAKKQGVRTPITGRVFVQIQLYPGRPEDAVKRMRKDPMNWDDDVRCIDLDNARKVLYDALKGIAFDDDKWVWKDEAERMEPDGEARVVVTIEPIVRVSPQATLLPESGEKIVDGVCAVTGAPYQARIKTGEMRIEGLGRQWPNALPEKPF